MDLRISSNNNFKGYDARHLKGFVMKQNPYGIAEELMSIGKKENFQLYFLTNDITRFSKPADLPRTSSVSSELWAQDFWTIAKGKLFSLDFDKEFDFLCSFFGLKKDLTQYVSRNVPEHKKAIEELHKVSSLYTNDPEGFQDLYLQLSSIRHKTHIPGGNMYLVKLSENNDGIIIGESELEKYPADEIMTMYGASKITVLPQMDYHIDLFIRPLNNKQILLADDNMTLDVMNKMLEKISGCKKNAPLIKRLRYKIIEGNLKRKIFDQKSAMAKNKLPNTKQVESILEASGYKVIRVPGRIYDCKTEIGGDLTLHHSCNYINAHVLLNENGEEVYITNKSNFDKDIGLSDKIAEEINCSFEKEFINSVSSYIKPEHIYFIEGEGGFVPNRMLPTYLGGIHCAAAEIPETVLN